jgi:hypothetical protein
MEMGLLVCAKAAVGKRETRIARQIRSVKALEKDFFLFIIYFFASSEDL